MEIAIETVSKEERWDLSPSFRVDIVENGRAWSWNDVKQTEVAKKIVATPAGIHLYAGEIVICPPGEPTVYVVPIGEKRSFTRELSDEYTLEQLYEALTFYAKQLCETLPHSLLPSASIDPQSRDTGVRLASDPSTSHPILADRTFRVEVKAGRKKHVRNVRVWFDIPEVSLPYVHAKGFAVVQVGESIPLVAFGWQQFCVNDSVTDERIKAAYKELAVKLRAKYVKSVPRPERPENVEVFTFIERQEVVLKQVQNE